MRAAVAAVNTIKSDAMRANKGVPNDLVQRLLDEELAGGNVENIDQF